MANATGRTIPLTFEEDHVNHITSENLTDGYTPTSTRASVAMAVYNGERFINEQLDSIISMLGEEDEIVISYDKSTDKTWDIIQKYSVADSRIRVINNISKSGVVGNFTNAINHCRGRYVFLCDQDDVWINNKINIVVALFEEHDPDLIVHDGYFVDAELNTLKGSIFDDYRISKNPIRNWIKGTCWGCCMAFNRRIVPLICPFPEENPHDVWTMFICGIAHKRIKLLPDKLIMHRLHGSNQTKGRRKLGVIIIDRAHMVGNCIKRIYKYRKHYTYIS